MPLTPPRFLEGIVKYLLPPATRDAILGDLHERYTSPAAYLADAATAFPAAIISQLRRTRPPAVVLIEAAVIYGAFLASALMDGDGFLQLKAIGRLTAIVMSALVWREVYASPLSVSETNPLMAWWKRRGMSGTVAGRRVCTGLQLLSSVYLPIYFACGVTWYWQLMFRGSRTFPTIMTSLNGVFFASFAVAIVRVVLERARRNPPRHAA